MAEAPRVLTSRFEDAFQMAADIHRDQRKKGTRVPYLAHLMGVGATVLDAGGDEDEAIAALLHDAVEDGGGLPVLERIRKRFGDRVADIVWGCTDAHTELKPPWRPRKEAYVRHLRTAPLDVRIVSAADKLYNARMVLADYRILGEALWDRFSGGREGTIWYYGAVAEALREAGEGDEPVRGAGDEANEAVDPAAGLREIVRELGRVASALRRATGTHAETDAAR